MLNLTLVQLRVSDLGRSRDYYVRQLGFVAAKESPAEVALAVQDNQPPLLTLKEDRSAKPSPSDAAGLFHAALLLPSRASLAHWLRHAVAADVAFDGFSDHGVSEAIYLSDPDGNGLEIYADRPRESWPRSGPEITMFTNSLDVRNLLQEPEINEVEPLAIAARWGHLHLRVTDLERSQGFYAPTLGLAVTQSSYPGARFLAADGYHHHIGLNTWGGVRRPQPAMVLGLISARFVRGGEPLAQTLVDPDGISIEVQPEHA